MAQRSKYAHLKPSVHELLRKGLQYADIAPQYREGDRYVPPGTLFGWCKAYSDAHSESIRNDSESIRNERRQFPLDKGSAATPPQSDDGAIAVNAEVVDDGKVVPIRGGDRARRSRDPRPREGDSDFDLALKQARWLAQSAESEAVQVQAVNSILRAIALRATLPHHVLHGEQKSAVEDHLQDLETLSDAEIAQLYKESLG